MLARLRAIERAALVVTPCTLLIVAIPPWASSDIITCPEVKPPRNDAAALRRAGFAFDGVVIGGREVHDPNTGAEILVSPLRLRVTRTFLGNPTVGAPAHRGTWPRRPILSTRR
jgi:hypothetical protein